MQLKKSVSIHVPPKNFEKRLLVLLRVPFARLSCGTSRLSLETFSSNFILVFFLNKISSPNSSLFEVL